MMIWEAAKLGDLVDIFDRKRVPLSSSQRALRPGPFAYYGAQGIIDYIDDFIFEGRFILVPEDGENLRSRKLPIAYFAEGQFWVNNHAHILKAKPGVAVDRFVQGALEATDLAPWVTGAAQPKLSQANLREIDLQVPPYSHQQKIAQVLDALDDLIENNRRRTEVLEEMARAIYREWFVHFRYPGRSDSELVSSLAGTTPRGWAVKAASTVLEINPRTSLDKFESHPVITMSDLSERLMICAPSGERVHMSGAKFVNGDTLFARITPCLENGKTGLVQCLRDDQVGVGSTEFIVLRGYEVGPSYTYCLARSEELRQHAIKSMSGASGRQRVRNDCFDRYFIAVPPRSVSTEFEAVVAPLFAKGWALELHARAVQDIRGLLLPRLVSGQIDVSTLDLDALVEEAVA